MSKSWDRKLALRWETDLRLVNSELEILKHHLLGRVEKMKRALKTTAAGVVYITEVDPAYAAAIERLEKFVLDGDDHATDAAPNGWIPALDYISKHNGMVERDESDLMNQLIDLDELQTRQRTLKALLDCK